MALFLDSGPWGALFKECAGGVVFKFWLYIYFFNMWCCVIFCFFLICGVVLENWCYVPPRRGSGYLYPKPALQSPSNLTPPPMPAMSPFLTPHQSLIAMHHQGKADNSGVATNINWEVLCLTFCALGIGTKEKVVCTRSRIQPGVYETCKERKRQIYGYSRCQLKSFTSGIEAVQYLDKD